MKIAEHFRIFDQNGFFEELDFSFLVQSGSSTDCLEAASNAFVEAIIL